MKRHFETLATLMVCMTMALCVSCKKDGDHEYVYLGLPSGLLWATCNVGANSPEDDAAHVNWGGAWRLPKTMTCYQTLVWHPLRFVSVANTHGLLFI